MPDNASEARFLTVARLLRAHGNRGELAAELDADDAGIFDSVLEVELWDGAGQREPARIQRVRPHKNRLILKFDGIDTIGEAERVAGWEVQIPAELRPPPRAGRLYVTDLIGCRVVERRAGRVLGEVRGVLETGAAPLLEVSDGAKEILVPFAEAICREIDMERRLIAVDLPEGLEELNQRG